MDTVIRITNAPEAYDYAYTKTLEVLPYQTRSGNRYRRIQIVGTSDDDYYLDHQVGRYHSGMYQTVTEERFAELLKELEGTWILPVEDDPADTCYHCSQPIASAPVYDGGEPGNPAYHPTCYATVRRTGAER